MAFGYAVYFTERSRNRVVRWDPDTGDVDIVAGEPSDGDYRQELADPYGLAFDSGGSLWIAEQLHHRLCRLQGSRLMEVALRDVDGHREDRPGQGSMPGYNPKRLMCPTSLYPDSSGAVYCSFYDDHTIYRIHQDGRLELMLGVLGNRPHVHGRTQETFSPAEATSAPVCGPTGVVVRQDGTIFFVERSRQIVREYHPGRGLRSVFPFSEIDRWRRQSSLPDRGRLDGYHPNSPCTLALDSGERLHLCETMHGGVIRIDEQRGTFETVCRRMTGPPVRPAEGPAALAFGPDGTAWVADASRASVRGYGVGQDGVWMPLQAELLGVRGKPLLFEPGGMGVVTG